MFFQSIRRCWRFGQKNEVHCHMITSEAESEVLNNMKRKEKLAIEMYQGIVRSINLAIKENKKNEYLEKVEIPSWL